MQEYHKCLILQEDVVRSTQSLNRNMTTRLMICTFYISHREDYADNFNGGKTLHHSFYLLEVLIIVHENTETNTRTAETLRRRALQVDSCMALSIRFGFDINKPSPTTCIRKLNCKLFKQTEQKMEQIGASRGHPN